MITSTLRQYELWLLGELERERNKPCPYFKSYIPQPREHLMRTHEGSHRSS